MVDITLGADEARKQALFQIHPWRNPCLETVPSRVNYQGPPVVPQHHSVASQCRFHLGRVARAPVKDPQGLTDLITDPVCANAVYDCVDFSALLRLLSEGANSGDATRIAGEGQECPVGARP